MPEAKWAQSSWWMYTVLVDPELYGLDNAGMKDALAHAGIQTRLLWEPLHRSRPYRDCQGFACEEADHLYRAAISLPCSTGLDQAQQARVLDEIQRLARSMRGTCSI
jgi:dTDP-4-amino-4,6-dideoxygalactose transaminase